MGLKCEWNDSYTFKVFIVEDLNSDHNFGVIFASGWTLFFN